MNQTGFHRSLSLAGLIFILAAAAPFPARSGQNGLRLGLMQAINSIPLIVAEHQGYFRDEGLEVELVMFKSQLYREAALQAGQVDGSVSDLINAVNAWSNGFDVKVTSLTDGDFVLLGAPGGRVRSLADWKSPAVGKVRTGLLENSIVYYATERMLERAGADPAKVDLVTTVHIPNRLEMLLAGQIDAACLPEPVATVARLRGAYPIADTTVLAEPPGVLLFTRQALAEKGEAIRRMYRAYNRAVDELNRDGDRFRDLIVSRGEFPPVVRDALRLPRFHRAMLPPAELFSDVAGWMKAKGLIARLPDWSDVVAPGFLP